MNENKLLDGICQFLQNISTQTQSLFNEVQKEKGRQDASVQIEQNIKKQALRLAVDNKTDNVIPFIPKGKNAPTVQSESVKNTNDYDLTVATGGEKMPPKLKYGQGSISKKVRQNKKGTKYTYWTYRWMDNGYQRCITAKTLKELIEKSNLSENKQKKQEANKSNIISASMTFKEWLMQWFEKYKKPKLKERTAKSKLLYINDYILPKLGHIKLRNITTIQIQDFLIEYTNSATQKFLYDIINGSLRKATETRILKYNPVVGVELKKHKTIKKRCFTFDEQTLILNELAPKYKALFYFLCCTGLRIGEFLALTEKDIDKKNKLINVSKSYDYDNDLITSTKTENSRKIPYLNELFVVVKSFIKDKPFFGGYGYSPTYQAFRKAIRKNKLVGVTSVHSTRHTFASICYLERIPDKQIQAWLGHSTLDMTMDTYTHLLDNGTSEIREYIRKLKKNM